MQSEKKHELNAVKEIFEQYSNILSKEEIRSVNIALNKINIEQFKKRENIDDLRTTSDQIKENANNLLKTGAEIKDVIELYNSALDVDPTNYVVYSNRALMYSRINELDKAVDDCLVGLFVNPKFIKFHIRLAMIYMDSDQEKAIKYVKQGLEIEPDNQFLLEMKSKLNIPEQKTELPFGADGQNPFGGAFDELLQNKGIQDMVSNFVKDKSPDDLNKMLNSVLGSFGGKKN